MSGVTFEFAAMDHFAASASRLLREDSTPRLEPESAPSFLPRVNAWSMVATCFSPSILACSTALSTLAAISGYFLSHARIVALSTTFASSTVTFFVARSMLRSTLAKPCEYWPACRTTGVSVPVGLT